MPSELMESAEEILRYNELAQMRARLESGDLLTGPERRRFAASMLSARDVDLLKQIVSITNQAEDASDALFSLFTMGGIGNLTTAIRTWLESGDEDSAMTESGSVVLSGCVRQLSDGTALRTLLEFRDVHDVGVEAQHVLSDLDQSVIVRILQASRSQQIGELLDSARGTPSNRLLWTLRTYGRDQRVQAYLRHHAAAGNVAALVSLTISVPLVDWNVIAAARAETEFDYKLLVNVAIENIGRGAVWGESQSDDFFSRLPGDMRNHFLEELSGR